MRAFENWVMRGKFWAKLEVTDSWKQFYNEQFHNSHCGLLGYA
jgi:hypothetical protein